MGHFKHAYNSQNMAFFTIRQIGDYALSSVLFSPTIPLLYDVTRGSPDDEFQELGKLFQWTTTLLVK